MPGCYWTGLLEIIKSSDPLVIGQADVSHTIILHSHITYTNSIKVLSLDSAFHLRTFVGKMSINPSLSTLDPGTLARSLPRIYRKWKMLVLIMSLHVFPRLIKIIIVKYYFCRLRWFSIYTLKIACQMYKTIYFLLIRGNWAQYRLVWNWWKW